MYRFEDYKRHYEDCKKSLELTKKIVGQEAMKEILPSLAIKKLRQSLIRLFSKPELSQVCQKCKGDCCITRNFCLTPFELLCFTIDNPDFEFPEPDWKFLKRESENKRRLNGPCLFSSARGCLLKEHRPIICLLFYDCDFSFEPDSLKMKIKDFCSAAEKKKIFSTQSSRYLMARENFCQQVFQLAVSRDFSLALGIKGVLISGIISYTACIEVLEKLLYVCRNKSR